MSGIRTTCYRIFRFFERFFAFYLVHQSLSFSHCFISKRAVRCGYGSIVPLGCPKLLATIRQHTLVENIFVYKYKVVSFKSVNY